jgi:hypothetical protein
VTGLAMMDSDVAPGRVKVAQFAGVSQGEQHL